MILACSGSSGLRKYFKYGFDSDSKELSHVNWPQIVGDSLGIEVHNISEGVLVNEHILQKCTKYIVKNPTKYSICLIGWNNWFATYTYNVKSLKYLTGYITVTPNVWIRKEGYPEGYWHKKLQQVYDSPLGTVQEEEKAIVEWNLLSIFKPLEHLCEQYGIKLYSYHMFRPFGYRGMTELFPGVPEDAPVFPKWTDYLEEDVLFDEIESYTKYFDKNKFIGWPYHPKLGGSTFEDEAQIDRDRFYRSKVDVHPTDIGHQFIAEKFLNEIE